MKTLKACLSLVATVTVGTIVACSTTPTKAGLKDTPANQDGGKRDRGRDRNSDYDRDRFSKLEPGTIIAVRMKESIAVERSDINAVAVLASAINRVYRGIVDADVRSESGELAIPKGSDVELMVRVARDNGLLLDLESVVVNSHRYAVRTDLDRVESKSDGSEVGEIMGDLTSGHESGRAVNVPRNALVTFRLKRALDIGVADQGSDLDGIHYHGFNRRDR